MSDTLTDVAANKDADEEKLDQRQLAERLLAQAKQQGGGAVNRTGMPGDSLV